MKDYGVRIQKALSEAGVMSRRKAEEYIAAGKVRVDGRPVQPGMKIDVRKQIVTIDGEKVDLRGTGRKIYLALYKPRGIVTTMHDEKDRRDVTSLLEGIEERVYPVGRLDVNSEGLLIMTNDGEFANKLMHPRFHVPKTYRVTLDRDITDGQMVRLTEGIELDGKMTAPATLHVLIKEPGRVVLSITITEGRNRQIRRMFESFGFQIKRLKRSQIGPIKLGMLKPGGHRHLSKNEVERLMQIADSGFDRLPPSDKQTF